MLPLQMLPVLQELTPPEIAIGFIMLNLRLNPLQSRPQKQLRIDLPPLQPPQFLPPKQPPYLLSERPVRTRPLPKPIRTISFPCPFAMLTFLLLAVLVTTLCTTGPFVVLTAPCPVRCVTWWVPCRPVCLTLSECIPRDLAEQQSRNVSLFVLWSFLPRVIREEVASTLFVLSAVQ